MVSIFGEFELDEDLYELRHAGHPVSIEPRVFNVLAYLLAHRDRVVPKAELFEKLWAGEFVTDSALSYCIKAARKAVGDDGARQRVIKTLHGRGFRFMATVRTRLPGPTTAADAALRSVSPSAGSHFVGRERELSELNEGLEDALSGRGRLLLLIGEPGIGKTRTADELATSARQRNALVLVGRCHEGGGAPAFWPWVQVVRAYLRDHDPAVLTATMAAGAAVIAQVVPEVQERLTELTVPAALEPEQARFRLFDSIVTFLKNAARRRPLVLIFDDLHWADQPSLLLLQFLAREMRDTHLLVVGTYRDEQRGRQHPLTQTLGELARVDLSQRIALGGLTEQDVARFIENIVGSQPPASLVTAIHRETEGNPFFVTEIVRLLVTGDPQQWPEQLHQWKLTVPQTVREAIGRRLHTLSDECIRTLHLACVIGRQFDMTVLQHIREHTPPGDGADRVALLKALDEAGAARIIETVPPAMGRYRFVHALIREALYEEIASGDRVLSHRQVGEALEALHGTNPEPQLAILAHHFLQAAPGGDVHKAVRYAVQAGERATRQLAYEAAVNHYESALQLLAVGAVDECERCEVRLALGSAQWRAGDFAHARDTFQQAAVSARISGSAPQLSRAALGYGGGFRGFDLGVTEPVLIDLLEEALQILGPADSPLRAQVLARLAVALYHVPNSLERRASLSQAAVEMAGRVGDAAAHLGALYARHWAIWGPDNLDDRLVAANAMARLADQAGDREMALHAHRFRLIDALEVGDIDAVDADLDACAHLAEELQQPYYLWYVAYLRAMRAALDSRFDDAERLAQHAASVGQRAQSQNVAQIYGAQLLPLRREQGRLAELEPALRGLVDQYPALPSWRAGLAFILSELGREAEARVQFEVLAADDFIAMPRNPFWLTAMSVLSDVCAFLTDARRAGVLYRLLLPYRARTVVNLGAAYYGSVSRNLGRLAATMGHWQDARQHFDDALTLDERVGAPHLIAHTQHEYAEMLLAHGQPRDIAAASALLAQALATYTQAGMQTFQAKVAALQQDARMSAPGKPRAGVVRLAASRRSRG